MTPLDKFTKNNITQKSTAVFLLVDFSIYFKPNNSI